ncbi:MAG: hypothetical protein JW863_12310 [Chitinispirillaceae bacterium]|nr:hypothetical protein [Chitinispirillaceae bacterium]
MSDIFENDDDDISGIYDDDGNKINPELVPKPSLCLLCRKDNDPREEMLCTLNRLDQQDEEGEFLCGAYEQK